MAIRGQKTLTTRDYAVRRSKVWSSSTSLVVKNDYSHHRRLLVSSVAGRTILLLYPAECRTGAKGS